MKILNLMSNTFLFSFNTYCPKTSNRPEGFCHTNTQRQTAQSKQKQTISLQNSFSPIPEVEKNLAYNGLIYALHSDQLNVLPFSNSNMARDRKHTLMQSPRIMRLKHSFEFPQA